MAIYLLYFNLRGAERFEHIHGDKITGVARCDLARRFSGLARDLLSQHGIVSEPMSPRFGVWCIAFTLKPLEIEADAAEQLDAISAAGRELGRAALATELGSAVALHAGLEVGTLAVEGESVDAPRLLEQLRAHVSRARPPGARAGARERRTILDIIGRRVDILVQEIRSLESQRPVAFEALMRGPAGSPLRSPELLLEEAARCGLRTELELASFDCALSMAMLLPFPCRLAINLSPDLFGAQAVQRISKVPGLAERLILEITEHLPISAPGRLIEDLSGIRRAGALIAMDDAGCGYLNMDIIRLLKPDIVKLCITVTRRIGGGPDVVALVRDTVSMIRSQGASVLAEGVESEAQARLARECGCALAQGFYFSRPEGVGSAIARLGALSAEPVKSPR